MDGKVYILNADDGVFITVIDLGSSISSSPVVASDKVFIATEEGNLYYIDTSSNQARQLPDLGGRVSAPFTTSDGVVYVHTYKEEIIYALNAENGAIIWNSTISNQ
jgi:outer membrane protein assembly factor BamB